MIRSRQHHPVRLALISVVLAALTLILFSALKTNGNSFSAYAAYQQGATMHQLTLPEGALAYDDQGSGPLVVMVPGLGDLRQEYRFLASQLASAGYRAVTVDLRGHGGSSTGWPSYASEAAGGDLLALIEHLATGPATLIGNSFGAGPAVWAAAEKPEAVSGIVLIGPFVRDHDLPVHMRLLMRIMFSGPWKVHAWTWYHGTLFPTRKPADYDAYRVALRANLAEPGRFEALQAMLSRSDAAIEARLSDVKVPSLVVMGSRDPDFPDPAAEARWIAERLGGEIAMIEGAGHYPQAEMPDETTTTILDFIGANNARAAQTRIE